MVLDHAPVQPPAARQPRGRSARMLSRSGRYRASLFRAAHQLDTRRCRFHQAAIGREIVERHAARGEARLELLSDRIAVQVGKPADGGDRAGFVLDDEAGQALIDDLGTEPRL